ncbi:MAG: polysaccharide lyase family 7 protein [Hyphomonadaceae bacterium]
MLRSFLAGLFLVILSVGHADGQSIQNASFEEGFDHWSIAEDVRDAVAISDDASTGEASAKIVSDGGHIAQTISLEAGQHYELTARLKGKGLLGIKVGDRIYFERLSNGRRWKPITVKFNADEATTGAMFISFNGGTGRFDDLVLTAKGAQADQTLSANVVAKSAGGTGLSADLPPGGNFDLINWNLSISTDTDNNGKSDTISERRLAAGYEDERFFFTGEDGGLVMRSPIYGARTSTNTKYTRVELREMLRRGDTDIRTRTDNGTPNANNWVFSSAPEGAQRRAGAVDGTLDVTLAVNHVTGTGEAYQVGRFIIGQIHAKDDEPIRLYYRLLPGHERGSIYAAHESKFEDDDRYYVLIGDRSNRADEPANGIALNEPFSYRIEAVGDVLNVTISQYGVERASTQIDMTGSGYDAPNDYMYFKVGVYNQNNSGDPDEYDQATFYKIEASH